MPDTDTKIKVDKIFLFQVLGKVETLEKRVFECEKVEKWIVTQLQNPPQKTINDFIKLLEDNKVIQHDR